jgi:FixJ family two-component response regulator
MRQALQRVLDVAGFSCTAYESAEAFLTGGADEDVACVVSDLKLPVMSGFDLLAELQSRGSAPPFIVITAHDAPALRAEAVCRGAGAYLAKPFAGTELIETVKVAITRTKPAES